MTKSATRSVLLVGIFISALLAGCASSATDEPIKTNEITEEGLGTQLDGKVIGGSNATLSMDTPFLLAAETGPDAPLNSFLWRIPDGAIQKWRPIPSFPEFVIEFINLEMFPVLPDDIDISEYAILVFAVSDEASLVSGYVGTTMQGVDRGLGSSDAYGPELPAELEGGILTIFAGSLEEGDQLAFVVGARSEQSAPLNLLLSPVKIDPDDDFDTPDDADDLLRNRTAVRLPVFGQGNEFQFASYFLLNLFFPPTAFGFEYYSNGITVSDELPRDAEPAVTARDTVVSADFDYDGYSLGFADYWGFPTASAGKYDIQMNLQGTQVSHRNVIVEAPCTLICPPTGLVTGYPLAFATGDGSGGATTSFDLQVASVNEFEIFSVEQISVGATARELTGVDADVGGAAVTGLVGDLPPFYMWTNAGDVLMLRGNHVIQIGGLGDPVDAALAQYEAFSASS